MLLKRGIAATLEELLLSAEYIMSGGNYEVILCERGIRTFETYTRNTLDVSAIPIIKKLSHLPMTSDPSHGTGLARQGSADGLCIARGRRRRVADRSTPRTRQGAVRRCAVALSRAVCKIDGRVAHDRTSHRT